MAQCVASAEKRPIIGDKDVIDVDMQPSKRLKQVRLPFKPLDCKPLTPSPVANNSASKKRKSSGPDSPSKAKLSKFPDLRSSAEKLKPTKVNNDNEVSSSSEADGLLTIGNKSRNANNILEKFVRREDEISSTNDVIDLTGSAEIDENEENSLVKAKSPQKSKPKLPVETNAKENLCTPAEASLAESENCNENTCKSDKSSTTKKSEDHFARKLVFDVEKTSGDCKKADVEATPKAVLEEADRKGLEEDFAEENGADGTDELNEDEEDTTQDEKDTTQDDETPNQSMDVKTNSDDDDDDDDESSPSQKKEEGGLSSKTPVGKKRPLHTSTPQTCESVNTSCSSVDGTTPSSESKPKRTLSKKQTERAALRAKVKEEKERQKQEAKDQKEKERLEKKKKRDEEKAEKERAKNEEKEKKEKERLKKKEEVEKEKQEKLKQKEEERKKKQEILDAREEEKKKKEEEKRLKEEQKQKEEEEKQKQAEKRKAAFTSFFTKPKVVTSTKVDKAADNLFIPFEVKKDMTLAPVRRQVLSDGDKHLLDEALGKEVTGVTYLTQLRQGDRKPVRTNRILRKKVQADDEVELLVHDSEAVKKSMHAVKLLQFHTDYRPPYYGTWRKKLAGLSPRNPWKKYEDVFDYEVDSDEEWEEEEPGESLSDSNGEDEEGEEEDEGEEDGWMVPHGYLSADEGCEDDEEVTPEVLKARQRAKAQAWEAELKAKREVIPPIHIGCYWLDTPCSNARHLDILKRFEMMFLRTSPVETLISKPETVENGDKNADSSASKSTPGSKGCRKRALPEEAMPDLIRLLHGNPCGIKKLVREFRMYWRQKSSDLSASLNESKLEEEAEPQDKSLMDTTLTETDEAEKSGSKSSSAGTVSGAEGDKAKQGASPSITQNDSVVNEDANDSCVSKRQLEMKIMAIAVREKREGNKKHCWYVNSDILQQYNMADQPVENSWVYVSFDMTKKTPSKPAGQSKTPSKSAAETKTPNKPASNKKISNKSATEKTPQSIAAQRSSQDPDEKTDTHALVTPNKDVTGSEGTPKAEKNKKEVNGRKKPKDQPSIMAFAKKSSSKPSPGKTRQAPKSEDGSNTAEVVVIADDAQAVEESVTSEEEKKDANKGKQSSKMDEDCIVLD